MADTDVLIAGAGPTGLALALWLAQCGRRVRIVDQAAEPGTTSRALAVHARTLEFYRQLGVADAIVARALRFDTVNLWVAGRRVAHLSLGPIGAGSTAFPYVVIFPQDEHERLLIDRLHLRGIDVERPCTLRAFDDRGDRVIARLGHGDGRDEQCEAAYLAGCDGAHSAVRETLGVGFPGGTYAHLFYVADVDASGAAVNRELHVALDEADILAVFPMQGDGRVRLIGTIAPREDSGDRKPAWEDVSRDAIVRFGLAIQRVNWFSTYRVHHRVVSHFREGRVFLAGDAAHIHSPVGGQGMNTGIGDAMNLAWKLGAVLSSDIDAHVLDTYGPERIGFARRLVATTDRGFLIASSDGPIARFVRLRVLPRLLPVLFHWSIARRFLFRTLSQTAIHYRESGLSRGVAGDVRAGDRLPWVEVGSTGDDNYAPLSALDWQVHVYGEPQPAVVEACRSKSLALRAFAWRDTMRAKGFARDAIYLVRPDGYVGFAADAHGAGDLARYLDDWKIAPRR